MFCFLSQGYNSAKRLDTVQMKVRSSYSYNFSNLSSSFLMGSLTTPVEKYKRLVGVTSDLPVILPVCVFFTNSICLQWKGASSTPASPRKGASIFQLRGQCSITECIAGFI